MKQFLKNVSQKMFEKALYEIFEKAALVQELSKEDVFFKVVPKYLGELMTKYFRIEVEGMEHLPKNGGALIASNHSGFAGLDAFLLCYHILENTKRVPRVLIHHLWFINETTARMSQKMGFIEANYKNGVATLEKKKMVIIFPEGEDGNFKPTTIRYQLQPFKKGMVRMALETGSPIIPTLVIGAEESNINLATLDLNKYIPGLKLPLPLNLIPFPARWKIKFLPPITLSRGPEALNDDTFVRHTTQDLQDFMQIELDKEVAARKHIFR
jgi:1-acyl-sn-glycerol-3-phosphate acyltransferase